MVKGKIKNQNKVTFINVVEVSKRNYKFNRQVEVVE